MQMDRCFAFQSGEIVKSNSRTNFEEVVARIYPFPLNEVVRLSVNVERAD